MLLSTLIPKVTDSNEQKFAEVMLGKDEYIDLLDLPGDIERAKVHLVASMCHDESKIDLDSCEYCDDCFNPIPENPQDCKYNLCANVKNLSRLGVGVSLYFYYIKFAANFFLVASFVISLLQMIVFKKSNNQVNAYCQNLQTESCENFLKLDVNSTLFDYTFENIGNLILLRLLRDVRKRDKS